MSDISRGEGWWQASDRKWYPPDQHPDRQSSPSIAASEPPPPPPAPPVESPVTGPSRGRAKWIVGAALAVAIVALGAFLFLGRSDDKKTTASASESIAAGSSTNSSSASSTTTSSSAAVLTPAQLQARTVSAADLGPSFVDGMFVVDNTTPTPCGDDNLNKQVAPTIDVGSQATDPTTTAFFREEVSEYKDAATAARAFDLGAQGLRCTQGTLPGGSTLTLAPPKDLTSALGVRVVSIGFRVGGSSGDLIALLVGNRIVSMQFQAPSAASPSARPDELAIAKLGLTKLDG